LLTSQVSLFAGQRAKSSSCSTSVETVEMMTGIKDIPFSDAMSAACSAAAPNDPPLQELQRFSLQPFFPV